MSTPQFHKGDIGTVLTVTIYENGTPANLLGATITFWFRKPSGIAVSFAGAFVTDGSDGKVKWTSASGNLDEVGAWKYQIRVQLAPGDWRTTIADMDVLEVIGS